MSDVKTILITRPLLDARLLSEKLAEHGYASCLLPMITIENHNIDEKIIIGDEDVYAFTSANGVRAAQAAHLPPRHSFAVGPATQEACHLAGFPAQMGAGDVASLTELISQNQIAGRVWHLSGRDLAGDLCGALVKHGIMAENLPLYTAKACTDITPDIYTAIIENRIDAVMLYSKRSAAIFCDLIARANLIEKIQSKIFYCLSEPVGEMLKAQGYMNCHIADVPTEQALLKILPRMS